MQRVLLQEGQPAWLALLLLLSASLWSSLLLAHGAGPRWAARLDDQQVLPAGVTVQIRHSLAPQVLLSNESAQTLEVLDPRGRAFLRIGPAGVHADMHASAWYNTYSVAGLATPAAAQDPNAPARWRQVSADPAWGWFDPRLSLDNRPDRGLRPASQSPRWSIPLRYAEDAEHTLHGDFVSTQAQGRWQSRLVRSGRIADDLSLALISGPVDAFMVRNAGPHPITVLGLESEPFLQVGPEGVYANAASPTWRAWGRNRFPYSTPSSAETPSWTKISSSQTYTWLDPRTRPASSESVPGSTDAAPHTWSIPVRIGERHEDLRGQSHWQPMSRVDSPQTSMTMTSAPAHAHRPVAAAKPWPRVQVQVHPDAMSGWNVHVRTDNFRFSPEAAGQARQDGQGHAHLYVDGQKVARLYGPWFHLPHLTPGSHYLHVTLNADDHSVWTADGQLIGHRIRIEVPEEPTGMRGMPGMSRQDAAHSPGSPPMTHMVTAMPPTQPSKPMAAE